MGGRGLPAEFRRRLLELVEAGRRVAEVAQDPGTAEQTVCNRRRQNGIDRGCQAILYEHPSFQGRSTVVREPIEDLGNERVGNDTVSSIQLDCSGHGIHVDDDHPSGYGREPAYRRGVTLYDDTDFRGRAETFVESASDLRDSGIGDNRARSVRVDSGCRAILWTGPDYRGDSLVVDRDLDDLSRTRIGWDTVTSLEVDCR